MRFEDARWYVEKLEAEAHQALIPTTDSKGKRAWFTGSGLHTTFSVLKFQHDSGKKIFAPMTSLPPFAKMSHCGTGQRLGGRGKLPG